MFDQILSKTIFFLGIEGVCTLLEIVCVCVKKRQPCVAYKCTQAANAHVVEGSIMYVVYS